MQELLEQDEGLLIYDELIDKAMEEDDEKLKRRPRKNSKVINFRKVP